MLSRALHVIYWKGFIVVNACLPAGRFEVYSAFLRVKLPVRLPFSEELLLFSHCRVSYDVLFWLKTIILGTKWILRWTIGLLCAVTYVYWLFGTQVPLVLEAFYILPTKCQLCEFSCPWIAGCVWCSEGIKNRISWFCLRCIYRNNGAAFQSYFLFAAAGLFCPQL